LSTALRNLIGREVCAVVYDSQVSINYCQRTGDLRGANLCTVAFQVVALTLPDGSSSLPDVEVRILDARTVCRGPVRAAHEHGDHRGDATAVVPSRVPKRAAVAALLL
jgi:hypothetical protein